MSLERRERDLALSRFSQPRMKPIQSSSSKKQVVEIIKNRFLLACVHDEAAFAGSKLARESLTYSIDRELVRRLETVLIRFSSSSFFFFLHLFPRSLHSTHLFLSLSLSPLPTLHLPNSYLGLRAVLRGLRAPQPRKDLPLLRQDGGAARGKIVFSSPLRSPFFFLSSFFSENEKKNAGRPRVSRNESRTYDPIAANPSKHS